MVWDFSMLINTCLIQDFYILINICLIQDFYMLINTWLIQDFYTLINTCLIQDFYILINTCLIQNFLTVEIPTPKPYIFMIRVTRRIKFLVVHTKIKSYKVDHTKSTYKVFLYVDFV